MAGISAPHMRDSAKTGFCKEFTHELRPTPSHTVPDIVSCVFSVRTKQTQQAVVGDVEANFTTTPTADQINGFRTACMKPLSLDLSKRSHSSSGLASISTCAPVVTALAFKARIPID